MTQHLTREQIYDLLISRETGECLEHLKTCAACAAEVSELQIAFSSFAGAARDWSGNQDLPEVTLTPATGRGKFRMRVPRVAWALVAAVLLSFFVWGAAYKRRMAPSTEAQSDEILMQQIDTEVSRRTPAAMDPLVQGISASATNSTNRFPTSQSGSQGQGEVK
jgi:hypothetical protein